MNRRDKELLVDSLRQEFSQSQAAFLVSVQGLTVNQVQTLRRGVRQHGGSMKVAKNTLLTIASEGISGTEGLKPYFATQIAIVFAHDNVPAIAGVLHRAKEMENFAFVAGSFDGVLVDKSKLEFLATLPSREQLLAQVCGTLKAPITSYVGIMNQLLVRFLWVLKQASEKGQ